MTRRIAAALLLAFCISAACATCLFLTSCSVNALPIPDAGALADAVQYAYSAELVMLGADVVAADGAQPLTHPENGASYLPLDDGWFTSRESLLAYVTGAFSDAYFAEFPAEYRMFSEYAANGAPAYAEIDGVLCVNAALLDEPPEYADLDLASLVIKSTGAGAGTVTVTSRDKLTLRTYHIKVKRVDGQPDIFVADGYTDGVPPTE